MVYVLKQNILSLWWWPVKNEHGLTININHRVWKKKVLQYLNVKPTINKGDVIFLNRWAKHSQNPATNPKNFRKPTNDSLHAQSFVFNSYTSWFLVCFCLTFLSHLRSYGDSTSVLKFYLKHWLSGCSTHHPWFTLQMTYSLHHSRIISVVTLTAFFVHCSFFCQKCLIGCP